MDCYYYSMRWSRRLTPLLLLLLLFEGGYWISNSDTGPQHAEKFAEKWPNVVQLFDQIVAIDQ